MCCNSDIVFLQETWLSPSEIVILKALHPDFYADGVSAFQEDEQLIGRPHGGIGILWRKTLGAHVNCLKYDGERRLMALSVKHGSHNLLLLNVYLPYFTGSDNDDNYHEFMAVIGKAIGIIGTSPTLNACIIGDFNACTTKNTLFGKEIRLMCDDNGLLLSDVTLLPPDSFTFYSEVHQSTSWLDHCVSTLQAHLSITDINIAYDVLSSDHFPLAMSFELPTSELSGPEPVRSTTIRDNTASWERATKSDIEAYHRRCSPLLSSIAIPHVTLLCSDAQCDNISHREAISKLYRDITNAMLTSSAASIPTKRQQRHKPVPGWNEFVKEHHAAARLSFTLWVSAGKPRQGSLHEQMSRDRARFKFALRRCKRDEAQIKADKLAESFLPLDNTAFWKEVQAQSLRSTPLVASVNGTSGEDAIANMWAKHYGEILNASDTDTSRKRVIKELHAAYESAVSEGSLNNSLFSPREVEKSIAKMKRGKAAANDGLSAEHLIYAPSQIHVLLMMSFNLSLTHNYLPPFVTESTIIPIIKDKSGNGSDIGNYRPIALSSAITKVLESLILCKAASFLSSSDHQFGFKSHHSTDMCVYALKEIVRYYLSKSTPVFACFMDASKAFDKLNYFTLFEKLLKRKMPVLIIRILFYWYCTQQIRVKWGSAMSNYFNVSNGVRQGGVLSPVLFNIYVDDLSFMLRDSRIGCSVSESICNHLFYADDLVLLSPSEKGLQHLLNLCYNYSISHDITFNPKKTVCMLFKPRTSTFKKHCKVSLGGNVLSVTPSCKYLGVFISNDCSDNTDLARQLRSFYVRSNYLSRYFSACTPAVKCSLFTTFCGNIYSGHCWSIFKKSAMRKLTIAFNNSFRRFMFYPRFCSASGMFAFNHVKSLNEILRHAIFNFQKRILNSSNNLICSILSCTVFNSSLWHHWKSVLFMN
jgi:exonuclease III